MTTYLLNALPNILLPEANQEVLIHGLTTERAARVLSDGFVSCVGHESTAALLSKKLGLQVEPNRTPAPSEPGSLYVCATFVPPRRLEVGEAWTEEEILSCPVKFVMFIR